MLKRRHTLTPIKKFVSSLLRPNGTRQPTRTQAPAHPSHTPLRIGLQTIDVDSDAVVITVLDTAPFRCHEDLVYMSRASLVQVALALNAKLPRALHIDVNPSRSDVFIRNSIEFLVGLRGVAPGATLGRSQSQPAGIRSRANGDTTSSSQLDHNVGGLLTAAKRRHSQDVYAPLAPLDEELEEEQVILDRPSKRRRVSVDPPLDMPTLDILSPSRNFARRKRFWT